MEAYKRVFEDKIIGKIVNIFILKYHFSAKIVVCYAIIYNQLEAFWPELKLKPMSLDLYIFLLGFGPVVYAMGTTTLIIIFFPQVIDYLNF